MQDQIIYLHMKVTIEGKSSQGRPKLATDGNTLSGKLRNNCKKGARRRIQLLDELRNKTRYLELKEDVEGLDMWKQ